MSQWLVTGGWWLDFDFNKRQQSLVTRSRIADHRSLTPHLLIIEVKMYCPSAIAIAIGNTAAYES